MSDNLQVQDLHALLTEAVKLGNAWRKNTANHSLPIGLQNLLRALSPEDSQTVPQIARGLGTSRQNIQVLMNSLLKRKLVEFVSNPAHQRSRLVRLTEEGRQFVVNLTQNETS